MEFQSIENYAVIGNMKSVALVGKEGSIDFFCYPNFDSPSIFAALLDPDKGGYFCIRPLLDGKNTKQLYLPDTNVILTRFLADNGLAEVTDFMPVSDDEESNQIIRIVTVVRGEVEFQMECFPRFDYARATHALRFDDEGRAAIFEPQQETQTSMLLQSNIALAAADAGGEKPGVLSKFTLKAGESAFFILERFDPEKKLVPLESREVEECLQGTTDYWRTWLKKSKYRGRWREMVDRSALVLKLLTSQKYGSLIAAPTFGLPESMGGDRNWDYRYTWLRDSAFTLYAFMRLGFTEESDRFREWLRQRFNYEAEEGPLQVLYAVDGRQQVPEEELPHLRGYRDSKPVRIGNAAYCQLQLDIYGEMFDAIYLSNKYGTAISHQGWVAMKNVLNWLAKNWDKPDEGIWEVRGGRRHFLHSRLMCWVAFDRAIRLGAKRSLAGPFGWMEEARDAITEDIYNNFWDEELGAFVQYKGSKTLDAAVLLMPLVRFCSATDHQFLSTLDAIERELTVDTLVYRYRNEISLEGLTGEEGGFSACTFWYIECLARAHRVDKARLLFEKMLGYANHVGLYSEEQSPSGTFLGNFPQALTHLAFISAATYLDRAISGEAQTEWS
jgi:GH15 family glucan-1,4-alpha-glucosidase